MDLQIIAIYFFTDEVLKSFGFQDDKQVKMTTAEIITLVLTSALFFHGNHRSTAHFLKSYRYIPNILSEGHLNYRLHQISEEIWNRIFTILSSHFQKINNSSEYAVDSFPVSSCDNIRIFRSKLYRGEKHRGYVASKKRFFYGIRVHMVVSSQGHPVEFCFAPGSENDLKVFKCFHLDFPGKATIYADKAYTSYEYEDFLKENTKIELIAQRKTSSNRQHSGCLRYLQSRIRKRIETTFSQIVQLFPRSIHAITARGFELKVFLFVLAYAIRCFNLVSV